MKRIGIIFGAILCATTCNATEYVGYFSDGAHYETTSCSDGGDVTLPTAPTPPEPGYVFTGWSVDTYDFSTLNANTNGTSARSKGLNGICRSNSGTTVTCGVPDDNVFGNGNWRTNFSYGDIYGDALCSETSGTTNVAGTPNEAVTGKYCWCRVRGYKPTGSHTKIYIPTTSPEWIFHNTFPSTSECVANCTTSCSFTVRDSSAMRTALFQ